MPQFAPPVVRVDQDTSLRQPVYVPAQTTRPRAHRLGWRRRGEDGEGSSTESQADLQAVVDSQYPEYVVIEASPRETGVEVGDVFLSSLPLLLCSSVWQVLPSPPPVSPPPAEQSSGASYQSHTPRHNLPISSTMFLDALMSSQQEQMTNAVSSLSASSMLLSRTMVCAQTFVYPQWAESCPSVHCG